MPGPDVVTPIAPVPYGAPQPDATLWNALVGAASSWLSGFAGFNPNRADINQALATADANRAAASGQLVTLANIANASQSSGDSAALAAHIAGTGHIQTHILNPPDIADAPNPWSNFDTMGNLMNGAITDHINEVDRVLNLWFGDPYPVGPWLPAPLG